MHNYYSDTNLGMSFGSVQLSDMNKVPALIRSGLSLNLDSEAEKRRSRVLSLSDLALEAVSPVMSVSINDGSRPDSQNIMTTPTPTQFLFPRSVTAEQEAYASGFALALEEIYRAEGRALGSNATSSSVVQCQQTGNGLLTNGNSDVWQLSSTSSHVTSDYRLQPAHTTSTNCLTETFQDNPFPSVPNRATKSPCSVGEACSFTGGFNDSSASSSSHDISCFSTVGSVSGLTVASSGLYIPSADFTNCLSKLSTGHLLLTDSLVTTSAPSVPITVNMQDQDRWRIERKRAKNRVAAARCQMRKIERITKLEDKARDLRNYNAQLAQTAAVLHQHVVRLQKQIMSHTEQGCRLLVPSLQ